MDARGGDGPKLLARLSAVGGRLGMSRDFGLIRGSGTVFRDFGDPNADLEQARAILAARIIRTLDERKLSTREAAKLTGVAHTEFSRIRNAKLDRFTLDRLISILGKLDKKVEVSVSFRTRDRRSRQAPRQVA
jgi:predicted XRE-type DNA-binding protein